MPLMTTVTQVRALPVGALHADDDTACTAPDVCERMVYWPGGAPATLSECDED